MPLLDPDLGAASAYTAGYSAGTGTGMLPMPYPDQPKHIDKAWVGTTHTHSGFPGPRVYMPGFARPQKFLGSLTKDTF